MHPNSINNIAYNYCTGYGLDEGKYIAYICDIVGKVEMYEKYFFVIFDVQENHELEKSMEKIFFMNTIMLWRETEKKGHGYKMSNLYKKFKVLK